MEIKRQIDNETFKGEVTYDMPLYEERIQLLKEMNLRITEDGSVESDGIKKLEGVYDYSLKMKSIACKYVKSLKLQCKHDESIIVENVDDLLSYEEGASLTADFAHTILNGVKLGNGLPNS